MAFTFFFRDRHTLEQLADKIISNKKEGDPIKLWDAGCAMGPEPYTFALILREKIGKDWFKNVKIIATDIDENNTFHKIIESGIYPLNELERMPEDIFKKYFMKYDDKNHYILSEEIKKSLVFYKQDLLELVPIDSNFDAIICKNVLLHFTQSQRIDVLKMFYTVLKLGGYLATEQTQPMPDELISKYEKVVSNANIYIRN